MHTLSRYVLIKNVDMLIHLYCPPSKLKISIFFFSVDLAITMISFAKVFTIDGIFLIYHQEISVISYMEALQFLLFFIFHYLHCIYIWLFTMHLLSISTAWLFFSSCELTWQNINRSHILHNAISAPLSKNTVSAFQISWRLLSFTLKDSWRN